MITTVCSTSQTTISSPRQIAREVLRSQITTQAAPKEEPTGRIQPANARVHGTVCVKCNHQIADGCWKHQTQVPVPHIDTLCSRLRRISSQRSVYNLSTIIYH